MCECRARTCPPGSSSIRRGGCCRQICATHTATPSASLTATRPRLITTVFPAVLGALEGHCRNGSVSGNENRLTIYCRPGRGHETRLDVERFSTTAVAKGRFAVHAGEPLTIGGFDAVFRWADDPLLNRHDREYGHFAWQPDCWLVTGLSFDDTHHRIAPDTRELARVIAEHTLDQMLAHCPE